MLKILVEEETQYLSLAFVVLEFFLNSRGKNCFNGPKVKPPFLKPSKKNLIAMFQELNKSWMLIILWIKHLVLDIHIVYVVVAY